MTIRSAAPGDETTLLALISALARFEKLDHTVTATAEALRDHLFGPRPACEAILAEEDGVALGFALFFSTYSTFLAKPGLWLEDLFVLETHRRRGIGGLLLAEVRRLAQVRGCGRLEWSVLDWNANAIAFYERFGAHVHPEWRICRVTLEDEAAP